MSDFAGHSRAGIRSFSRVLLIVLPILYWRAQGDYYIFFSDLWHILICFALAYLGALFPDIDIKSRSQKYIFIVLLILMAALIYKKYYGWAAGFGFFALGGATFKHRGFLHTKTAAIILPLPLLIPPLLISPTIRDIGIEYYLSAVIGYFSHLRADEPNPDKKLIPKKITNKIRKRKLEETSQD